MEFRDAQTYAFDWLQSRPKAILAMQQRIGKTLVAARDIQHEFGNIICPAFLKRAWYNAIAEYRPDLEPRILYNGDRAADGGKWWITNYEVLQDTRICAAPGLIVDEGHYCTGWESKRSHTVIALAEQSERMRWLTGTVMPNRSMDLWPAMKACGAIAMDFDTFGERYADGWCDQYGEWHFQGNSNTVELKAKLKPYILRITREQCGMPANLWEVVALDLPTGDGDGLLRRRYSIDEIAAAKNPLKSIEGLAEVYHAQGLAKVPLIGEFAHNVLRDEGPILLFAWHQDVIEAVAMNLKQRAHSVRTITGKTSHKQREAIVEEFQSGMVDVLIANRVAAGVGLPLHRAEHVIFGEGAWNQTGLEQPADRSVSMDKPLSVPVDILTIHGSIDDVMVRRCLEKQGVADAIIEPEQEFSTWLQRKNLPKTSGRQRLRESLSRPFAHLRVR